MFDALDETLVAMMASCPFCGQFLTYQTDYTCEDGFRDWIGHEEPLDGSLNVCILRDFEITDNSEITEWNTRTSAKCVK